MNSPLYRPKAAYRLIAPLLCMLAPVWLSGCEEEDFSWDEDHHANVIFIVVDTLRADHMGSYGHDRPTTPHLDALAREGVRFERAYASAPWTKPSVASMFTGLHASSHAVLRMNRSLPLEAKTIAERLRITGYATGAVISHHLIGSDYGFAQGFQHFFEDNAKGHLHVSTKSVTKQAISLLDRFAQKPDQPFFLFAHYFDPHYAYLRHKQYDFAGPRPPRIKWSRGIKALRRLDPPLNKEELDYLRDSYDEEIRSTDEGIGELLAAVREHGLTDDTLIIFTSDHGEEFYERGWLGHSVSLFEELVHVPLIIRLPKAEEAGRTVPEPVSLVSLPATILEVTRVKFKLTDFQEGSLVKFMNNGIDSKSSLLAYMEMDYERGPGEAVPRSQGPARRSAVVTKQYKLIYEQEGDRLSLYDLETDPGETVDLSEKLPDVTEALSAPLQHNMEVVRQSRLSPEVRQIPEKQKQMLRELGYVD